MPIDPQHLLSLPPRVTRHRYAERDCMLYALGVGAGRQADARDLRFVYEDGLQALPTMAVVLGYPGFWQKEPQYGIDWRRVLHAEQSCTFHAPLPVSGEVISEMSIDAIVDKGAGRGCLPAGHASDKARLKRRPAGDRPADVLPARRRRLRVVR